MCLATGHFVNFLSRFIQGRKKCVLLPLLWALDFVLLLLSFCVVTLRFFSVLTATIICRHSSFAVNNKVFFSAFLNVTALSLTPLPIQNV